MKPEYNFDTYQGDDDFLLSKITEREDAEELLFRKSIPELWTAVQERNPDMKVGRTVVVNKYAEDFDVDIMRPSIWGNPYRIGEDGTREEVIQKYKERLLGLPHLIKLAKERLTGKVLGCCCKPQLCHGDVLIELIEGDKNE